tara:strand:+ start:58807 stop:59628 length:822 start_codon:yes stop_codon:yes gene_type:complete
MESPNNTLFEGIIECIQDDPEIAERWCEGIAKLCADTISEVECVDADVCRGCIDGANKIMKICFGVDKKYDADNSSTRRKEMTHETASIIIKGPVGCGKSIIIDKIARIINSSGAKYNSPCLEIERNGNDFDKLDQWQIDSIKNVVWCISEETSSSLSAQPQPKEETHMFGKEEINQAKAEANEAIQKLADAVSVSSEQEIQNQWAFVVGQVESSNQALKAENDSLQEEVNSLKKERSKILELNKALNNKCTEVWYLYHEDRQKLSIITQALK